MARRRAAVGRFRASVVVVQAASSRAGYGASGCDLIPALRSCSQEPNTHGAPPFTSPTRSWSKARSTSCTFRAGFRTSNSPGKSQSLARFLNRLASFSRLIIFDKRGTGLSDRVPPAALPPLEGRMDDLRAVTDSAGSDRAAVFGFSEGGNLSALFAASYPQRTACAHAVWHVREANLESRLPVGADAGACASSNPEHVEREWGRGMDLEQYVPSKLNDEPFMRRLAAYFRSAASPGAAVALLRMNTEIDIRHVLPAIHVPTLVMHRTGDRSANVEEGRWMAGQIPEARFVELSGDDHMPWVGDQDSILDEVQEFLTGDRSRARTRPCPRDRARDGHRRFDLTCHPAG